MTVLYIVLAVAGFAGAKYLHARFFPWKDCPRCGGKRRNYSMSAHRDCGRCGSTGRVRRWGAPGEER